MKPSTIYSRRLSATLDDARSQFSAFADSFGHVLHGRTAFAPVFEKAWQQYRRETGRTFVAFVKALVPDLPLAEKAYMRDRRFQAALYLHRKIDAPETVYRKDRRNGMLSPMELCAVTTRSLMLLTHPRQADTWRAIAKLAGWHQRDLNRLLALTKESAGIQLPGFPRLVKRPPSTVADAIADLAITA